MLTLQYPQTYHTAQQPQSSKIATYLSRRRTEWEACGDSRSALVPVQPEIYPIQIVSV